MERCAAPTMVACASRPLRFARRRAPPPPAPHSLAAAAALRLAPPLLRRPAAHRLRLRAPRAAAAGAPEASEPPPPEPLASPPPPRDTPNLLNANAAYCLGCIWLVFLTDMSGIGPVVLSGDNVPLNLALLQWVRASGLHARRAGRALAR
jgi:hypothetical protein